MKSVRDETELVTMLRDDKSKIEVRRVMYTKNEPVMLITERDGKEHFFWARLSAAEAKQLGAALLGLANLYEGKKS